MNLCSANSAENPAKTDSCASEINPQPDLPTIQDVENLKFFLICDSITFKYIGKIINGLKKLKEYKIHKRY
jgi:hypothetical protein